MVWARVEIEHDALMRPDLSRRRDISLVNQMYPFVELIITAFDVMGGNRPVFAAQFDSSSSVLHLITPGVQVGKISVRRGRQHSSIFLHHLGVLGLCLTRIDVCTRKGEVRTVGTV